jgi:hypothetical protein
MVHTTFLLKAAEVELLYQSGYRLIEIAHSQPLPNAIPKAQRKWQEGLLQSFIGDSQSHLYR